MGIEFDASLISELASIVGQEYVYTDTESATFYGSDWTKVYKPAPGAVILPKTIKQVQALVQLANREDIAIVPSGGRTGLSGGAVAARGELLIALDNLNTIHKFNVTDRTVVCGAGVITERLQEFANQQDLFYPVDFSSSGSSQIGGNISTNAGGMRVIRYGMTRDWVVGLKVVTGNGFLLDLNKGLKKNNAGYDLRQLFIGSEGTLGIVVEATMQLSRPPIDLSVLVLGLHDMSGIMDVLNTFQKEIDLTAFEFFSELALEKVVAHSDLNQPFEASTEYYVLLEFENFSSKTEQLVMNLFRRCVKQGWVVDGIMSQNTSQLQNLWKLREEISESIAQWTPYKNDISVLPSMVPEFLVDVGSFLSNQYKDFEVIWFGHIGDGNMHLNILKPDGLEIDEFHKCCELVSKQVFSIVQRYDGSISAEHGVGLLKKDYLSYSCSKEEINLMKQIKLAFDPKLIMNPGKIFE